MAKKKKYGMGKRGVVRNYIEDPSHALYQEQIDRSKANYNSMSNPFVQGMNILGGLGLNFGMQGLQGASMGDIGQMFKGVAQNVGDKFALGGMTNNNAEVEGGEVMQTPGNNPIEIKGAKHEQGGVNINLPDGTSIFSDRIQIDGKTIAQRKKLRDKKLAKQKELMEKEPLNEIHKNTLNRISSFNKRQENNDMYLQEVVKQIVGENNNLNPKYGLGKLPELKPLPGINPYDVFNNRAKTDSSFNRNHTPLFGNALNELSNYKNRTSFGDLAGMAGDLYGMFKPMQNTERNRAGDRVNENMFQDFGQDALETIENSKRNLSTIKDNQLMDSKLSAEASRNRLRGSARGVNTMRALDFMTSSGENKNDRSIMNQFSQNMLAQDNRKAQLENVRDSRVMAGADKADIANRRDRDIYFTNLAKNITTKSEALQAIGKVLNKGADSREAFDLIDKLKEEGNLSAKMIAALENMVMFNNSLNPTTNGK